MEGIIDRIIREWKEHEGITEDHSNLKLKHHDHELGIYTIYFNIGREVIRLKALHTIEDTLLNKLKKLFGIRQRYILKITNMSLFLCLTMGR